MAPDRNEMARLHEEFLAELNGGRNSRGSGQTWQDQGDGRGNRLTQDFAFAWDGKSTTTKGITLDRAMIAKIREQAGGERPEIGLRWYGSEDLRQVDEDWIAISAADYGELLEAARLAEQARDAMRRVAEADAALDLGRQQTIAQGYAVPEVTQPPAPPPPPQLGGLPVPPPQMWPCLVIDGKHDPDTSQMTNSGYFITGEGLVRSYDILSVRVEPMSATESRLIVNEQLIHRGLLYVDGDLKLAVGRPAA